jgi:hypothetical protein
MSVPSSPGSATTGAPKKRVSPARNIIGLLLLLALVAVVWLEYSAHFRYTGAVKALEARTQDEDKGLMDVPEAETLLGKSPDGPGIEITNNDLTFTKKTYTWRALLRPKTLTAFYTDHALGTRALAGWKGNDLRQNGSGTRAPLGHVPGSINRSRVEPASARPPRRNRSDGRSMACSRRPGLAQ